MAEPTGDDWLRAATETEQLVTIQLSASELAFMRGFDPDRDRVSTRRDVVAVIEHWQAVLGEAVLRAKRTPPPWVCRFNASWEHIDAPCTGNHVEPRLGTSLTQHGLKNRDVPTPVPVLDTTCQTCGKRISRENAQASRWWHVGYTDDEIGHGALPAW